MVPADTARLHSSVPATMNVMNRQALNMSEILNTDHGSMWRTTRLTFLARSRPS